MKINIKAFDASYRQLASSFKCGNSAIDNFLNSPNATNPNYGKTFIYLSNDEKEIIGFYTISAGSIEENNEYHTKAGGAIHIDYFAIDQRFHNKQQYETDDGTIFHVSDFLLQNCLNHISSIRDKHVGFSFITLFSTTAGQELYKRNGFIDLEPEYLLHFQYDEKECFPMYYGLDWE